MSSGERRWCFGSCCWLQFPVFIVPDEKAVLLALPAFVQVFLPILMFAVAALPPLVAGVAGIDASTDAAGHDRTFLSLVLARAAATCPLYE